MDSESKRTFSFMEACEALDLAPAKMRVLLEEYNAALRLGVLEPEASSRYLTSKTVESIRHILRYAHEGVEHDQIVERLELRRMGRGESEDVNTAIEILLNRLEVLEKRQDDAERLHLEERDRLVLALTKTQQELQRLKNGISVAASRRAKDQPLLRKLFTE